MSRQPPLEAQQQLSKNVPMLLLPRLCIGSLAVPVPFHRHFIGDTRICTYMFAPQHSS